MPRREEHQLVSGMIALATHVFTSKEPITAESACAAFFGGAIGAAIPDLLEPAVHPNHRRFFHSVVFNGGVVHATLKSMEQPRTLERVFGESIAIGNITHVAQDSQTPAGIPFFNESARARRRL